jgi:hypothetical protein
VCDSKKKREREEEEREREKKIASRIECHMIHHSTKEKGTKTNYFANKQSGRHTPTS